MLGNTDAPEQSKNLADWKKAYEQATGHRVLHISMHFDEGFLDKAGQPHYNPHAHVIVSRMNEKNRIIKLEREDLGAIQDLTAKTLKMERGITLAERGGKRGREHIQHNQFRQMAEEKRLALDAEKAKTEFEATLVNSQSLRAKSEKIKLTQAQSEAAKVPELQAQIERLSVEYAADKDNLKQAHDVALAELSSAGQKLALMQAKIDNLKAEYRADREELKASGTATQQNYQQLKATHEAALADLTASKAQAAKVPDLLEQLKAAQQEAINTKLTADERYKNLRSQALEIQAERDELAKKVATLSVAPPAQTPAPRPTPTPAPAVQAPAPGPTLAERLKASLETMAEWIAGVGGQSMPPTAAGHYIGAAKHMDELHCIQKTGRTSYTIHRLDALDAVPALGDPTMEIRYRDGVGRVVGRLGQGIER